MNFILQSHDHSVDTAATEDSCTQWTMSFESEDLVLDYINTLQTKPENDNLSFTIINSFS